MPASAVRADFDQPLDVHRNVFAQVAFDSAAVFDDVPDMIDFFLAQVRHLLVGRNVGLFQNGGRPRMTDAVDVRQCDSDVLVARKIHACNTCH